MQTLNHITVIGAGTMGQGIAQWFAQNFVSVNLVDTNQELAQKACQKIYASWDSLYEKGKFSGCQIGQFKQFLEGISKEQIKPSTDLVIEAIFEDLDLKISLFKELDQKLSTKTIFASNTSSFLIEKMAEHVSSPRQKNFVGLHFFNPATLMKLVEIIQTKYSDKHLCDELYQWFLAKDKKPAHCKDSPGFIVNRVARNYYGEAFRIIKEYDLDKIKEIDKVMREVGGFKMGPFELMDLIGIDVNLSVTKSVYEAYHHEPRFAPHKIQEEMVATNRIGKKVKKGFYTYE